MRVFDGIGIQKSPCRVFRLRFSVCFLLVPFVDFGAVVGFELVSGASQLLKLRFCLLQLPLSTGFLLSLLLDTLGKLYLFPFSVGDSGGNLEAFCIDVHERLRCDCDDVRLHATAFVLNGGELLTG